MKTDRQTEGQREGGREGEMIEQLKALMTLYDSRLECLLEELETEGSGVPP